MRVDTALAIFNTHRCSEETFRSELEDIFADGYLDIDEAQFLKKLIAPSPGIEVDANVVQQASFVLDQRIASKIAFNAWFDTISKTADTSHTTAGAPAAIYCERAVPRGENGFLISAHVFCDDESISAITIELPDASGRYADGSFTGDEPALLAAAQKKLAYQAIDRLNQRHERDDETIRHMFEATDKIGVEAKSRRKPFDFESPPRMNAFTDLMVPPSFGVLQRLISEGGLKELNVRGFTVLTHDGDPQWIALIRERLESELQYYPEYLLQQLRKGVDVIVVFDPERVYPQMVQGPKRWSLPPPPSLSWTDSSDGWGKIHLLISVKSSKDALLHEFGHVIGHHQEQKECDVTNLNGLETLAMSRRGEYAEDGFPTSYAGSGLNEMFPEALLTFYRGKTLHPFRAATGEELKREQPALYLMLIQLDAILEAGAHTMGETIDPEWAFSRNSLERARSYLQEKGASWDDPTHLEEFRQRTAFIDFSTSSEK